MFTRLKKRLSDFRRDQRGAVFIIVAVAMPVIFGAAAASIDMGHLLYVQSELRSAADAAALAATDELEDETAAKALAVQYGELNMPVSQNGNVVDPDDVILGNWSTDTSTFTAAGTPTNAVQVTARRSTLNGNAVSLYFAKLIGFDTKNLSVLAIASVSSGDQVFCILALSDTGDGVTMNGTVSLSMPNCGLAVESSMTLNGGGAPSDNSNITAQSVCVGGTTTNNGTTSVDPTPTDNCTGVPSDPLAGLAAPTFSGCDFTNFRINGNGGGATTTLSPGVYCGGITVNGTNHVVELSSGDYIMNGGGISMNGNTLTDDDNGGVYIYVTGDDDNTIGDVSFGGSATVNLTAQTTGTYASVLFHMDTGAGFSVGGSASTALNGTIYAPDDDVTYSGTSSQDSSCLQIISNTVTMNGTSEAFADPDDDGADGCDSSVVIAENSPPRLRD